MSVVNESGAQRLPRALRSVDLGALRTIAGAENLELADMVRLLLSYGTFKWRSSWRGTLGADSHSVKLLPGGIDAVKELADAEELTWELMACQLLAFAVETWEPGWRKDSPGRLGRDGVDKYRVERSQASQDRSQPAPFDHARFAQLRGQYAGMKQLPAQTPLPRR